VRTGELIVQEEEDCNWSESVRNRSV